VGPLLVTAVKLLRLDGLSMWQTRNAYGIFVGNLVENIRVKTEEGMER
jgi:hypothetical protein